MLTHLNIATMIRSLEYTAALGIEVSAELAGLSVETIRGYLRRASILLVYPLFHISGLTAVVTAAQTGGQVTMMPRWEPRAGAELIRTHQVTMLAGPPTVVSDLLRIPELADDIASLQNIAAGGQATPPDLTDLIRRALPTASQSTGWGMTETAGSVSTITGPVFAEAPTSVGRPSPLLDVAVVDPLGRHCAAGEVGELIVYGPVTMSGYWGRAEETATVLVDGWYHTGDIGRIDEHGRIYIVDRKKDMVISGGENIYCAEIETVLAATGSFDEVAVFGVPDDRLGERAIAAVTLREGVSLTEEDVRNMAAEHLASYKVPASVVFDLGPFARNATGKIRKPDLRAQYLSALAASGSV